MNTQNSKLDSNVAIYDGNIIGIDPGTKTGLACWCPIRKKLLCLETLSIHRAMFLVGSILERADHHQVFIEDPNTFIPFSKSNMVGITAKMQGAGSVKRDFAIWLAYLKDVGLELAQSIDIVAVKLQGTLKKMPQPEFKRLTGWQYSTTEHARDAALLVYGRAISPKISVKSPARPF